MKDVPYAAEYSASEWRGWRCPMLCMVSSASFLNVIACMIEADAGSAPLSLSPVRNERSDQRRVPMQSRYQYEPP